MPLASTTHKRHVPGGEQSEAAVHLDGSPVDIAERESLTSTPFQWFSCMTTSRKRLVYERGILGLFSASGTGFSGLLGDVWNGWSYQTCIYVVTESIFIVRNKIDVDNTLLFSGGRFGQSIW